jgi:hypothetical protein
MHICSTGTCTADQQNQLLDSSNHMQDSILNFRLQHQSLPQDEIHQLLVRLIQQHCPHRLKLTFIYSLLLLLPLLLAGAVLLLLLLPSPCHLVATSWWACRLQLRLSTR